MPVYEYRALDRAGKNRDGIIDADSPIAARQRLRETGFFPVSIKRIRFLRQRIRLRQNGSVAVYRTG